MMAARAQGGSRATRLALAVGQRLNDRETGLAAPVLGAVVERQDTIAITGQERGDMLALATQMKLEGDLIPGALAACPQTGGQERRRVTAGSG